MAYVITSEGFLKVTCRHANEPFWRAKHLLRNITMFFVLTLLLAFLLALMLHLPLLRHSLLL